MTGQPGQVGWVTTQLDRLTGAGGNRPGRELRRGRPRGKGSRGTLGSPGARRGGRRGRRRTDGGEFSGGELGDCEENGDGRRRLRASRGDSVGGEEEGGEVELGASSEEAGAARNGEGRRRPWRRAWVPAGVLGKKRESEEERERASWRC
jgi:hypothetical protein